jgi:hypothetical protein
MYDCVTFVFTDNLAHENIGRHTPNSSKALMA